ncbi:uracil phosphoribosyltransferase-domain-containing protein [Terfezia claveryi]|nr:uracil phosphoribosyltransferase-domain-containing protein [Terfezia claveryi]
MSPLPANVTVSNHPCLKVKLSQLRSATCSPKQTRALVKEISLLLACDALRSVLSVEEEGMDITPLGAEYPVETVSPKRIALIPILRSGLAMVEGTVPVSKLSYKLALIGTAFETILPENVPVHHLGLFREKTTLHPVEYYNNLPTGTANDASSCDVAIILDPVIATGGTAEAAIQTLRDWGVGKILVVSVLGSDQGLRRAATESGGVGIQVFVGGVDPKLESKGMIYPGIGDIGDRLFLTIGK